MPAVGQLLYFFMILIASLVVSFLVFSYFAHSFQQIVSVTAAGGDEVLWSAEPLVDRMGAALQLAYMVGSSFIPGAFLALVLRRALPHEPAGHLLFQGSLLSFWLIFPLVVVSCYTGPSPWLVLFPPALLRLARKPLDMLVVYLVSGVLLGAFGATAEVGLSIGMSMSPVVGLVGSTVALIYARLLGRWIWIINEGKPFLEETKNKPLPIIGTTEQVALPAHRKKRPRPSTGDPWKVMGTETKPSGPPPFEEKPFAPVIPEWMDVDLAAYGMAEETIAEEPPSEPSPIMREEPLSILPMQAITPEALEEEARARAMAQPVVSEHEMKLAERGRQEPPPAIPLLTGIYTFPWYEKSRRAWLMLAGGLLAVAALVSLLIQLVPGAAE